ncbi:pyridoxal phosphate-dependent decarboxylase family protein [Haloferax volcanii]|uniref:L-2,4-diaminobutyrate decarboxylase n=1 Tax=Haloferax volcanii JCM 10717 TaxID=1227458 RepID=M0IFR8_HALVO|nr:aspartate aminotransferase family protein [Haloferax alexandrinus]ELZ95615.1 L-2,4-diaminobutyrate decarboxylase [Haloferax alexandrinus JCM 10717]
MNGVGDVDGAGERRDPRPDAAKWFLSGDDDDRARYRDAMRRACDLVLDEFAAEATPYSGATPEEVDDALARFEMLPHEGDGVAAALDRTEPILRNSVGVSDPTCIAHLQCPPTIPALAAEALLTATNQSMDSWDQSPAATQLERRFVSELCDLFGYEDGDGVFTSGGTQSNFVGLLLARNRVVLEEYGVDVQQAGLPPEARDLCILCSADAHFTATQAASHLGLGENAVVTVPTDDDRRLSMAAFDEAVADLRERGKRPFAIVATAGTTDFGSIDPLGPLAERAAELDCWYHVDAAWGGALALSDDHADKLAGIEAADSVAVDFHKLFYQPISCGAVLVRDASAYDLIDRNAAYLNPVRDDDAGVPNLVSKSVQTTRRFDALKPFVTMQALGREGLASMVEYTIDLAADAARLIEADPDLRLVHDSDLNVVVFRYVPDHGRDGGGPADGPVNGPSADDLNEAIRDSLLDDGEAVVARTTVDGETCLKLTLLNPRTTREDLRDLLREISDRGTALEPTTDDRHA